MKTTYPKDIAIISGLFIFLIIFLAIVNLYMGTSLWNEFRNYEVKKVLIVAHLCGQYINNTNSELLFKNLYSAFDLGYLLLYDTLGNKIYDSRDSRFLPERKTDIQEIFKNLPLPGELKSSKDYICYYNPEPPFLLYIPVDERYNTLNRVFRWHLFYITTSLILVSFLGYFLIRNLFLPMQYVASVASRYGIEMKREDFVSETFNEIFKRIKAKEKELVEFAAYIAHEFRNSLAIITGLARLVEKGKASTAEIINECKAVEGVISKLIEYARPVKLNPIDVSINELIEETIKRVDVPKMIKIEKDIPQKITLKGDFELLLHSLINIIKNGIEAIEESGEIKISVRRDENSATISIKDTGIGIPEGEKDEIFNPFYSGKRGGTGLGLAYVKKVIELHNGKIDVLSQKKTGAEFVIRLPLK